ncbi:MAG: hypothetical protein QXV23_02150 [Candidatus Bathyarchaeia archaeon]
MGYVSVELVKALAQIKCDDIGFDTENAFNNFISELIEYASSLIDDYCGRSFSEPTPQTVKLVAALIVVNMLHAILQRKINPTVQATNIAVKIIEGEAFTDDLKMLLNPYRVLRVERG